MRIRLAVLHRDTIYLNRLKSALETKYRDRLVIYLFTNPQTALEEIHREKINVLLLEDAVGMDPQVLPAKCGVAYFVDSPEVDTVNGFPAVCRFQRTELIYKQILAIFSETLGESSLKNLYSSNTKVMIFSSPCGGTGTSTLAAACAAHFALAGKRCLYLNLEDFGGADTYFHGEGAADMSDVIYAVKRKQRSLPIKLESCTSRDRHGVLFFSMAKIAMDMLELTATDRLELISSLVEFGNYDVIVIDMMFNLQEETRRIFKLAHALVWVGDGMPASTLKLTRAYEALRVLDQERQAPLSERVVLLWNKMMVEQIGNQANFEIYSAGSIMKIRHQANDQIIYQLAESDVFDAILRM